MTSQAKGLMYVPVWVDNGVVKPLADSNGKIAVALESLGFTLDVNLESSDITLPVAEQSPITALQAKQYSWYESNWVDTGMPFTWTARFRQKISKTMTGATDYLASFAAVPDGSVIVLTHVCAWSDTANPTHIEWYVDQISFSPDIYVGPCDVAYRMVGGPCRVPMRVGDRPYCKFWGCAVGDKLYASVIGYIQAL